MIEIKEIHSIHFCDYSLTPKSVVGALDISQKPREGALLKIEGEAFADEAKTKSQDFCGYADLFCWPELGDPGLKDLKLQLKNLTNNGNKKFSADRYQLQQLHPLLQNAFHVATLDGLARVQGRSLFNEQVPVKNYYLCSDLLNLNRSELQTIEQLGFTEIKIKMGLNFDLEIKKINELFVDNSFRLRFDFNNKGSLDTLRLLKNKLNIQVQKRIDYIEDPFEFNKGSWQEGQKLFALAFDHQPHFQFLDPDILQSISVLIVKPSRQNLEQLSQLPKDFKVVFTSALDHPLGLAYALYCAQQFLMQRRYSQQKQPFSMGCLSLWTYQADDFGANFESDFLYQQGQFYKVQGTGLGFDQKLKELAWQRLF